MRTEPPPSVSSAIGPMPAATATAAPLLEAPQVLSGLMGMSGLSVRPKIGASAACSWPGLPVPQARR